MPKLYEFQVSLSGETVEFGLSSTDTGNASRLYRMFNLQIDALYNYQEINLQFVYNDYDAVYNGLDRVIV